MALPFRFEAGRFWQPGSGVSFQLDKTEDYDMEEIASKGGATVVIGPYRVKIIPETSLDGGYSLRVENHSYTIEEASHGSYFIDLEKVEFAGSNGFGESRGCFEVKW